MQYLLDFMSWVVNALLSQTGLQLIAAFVGGGYFSSFMAERWQRKRDRRALTHQNLCEFMRLYQRYARVLYERENHHSPDALDLMHADFISSIKILTLDPQMSDLYPQLLNTSKRMVNIRKGQVPEPKIRPTLNKIRDEIGQVITEINTRIWRSGGSRF